MQKWSKRILVNFLFDIHNHFINSQDNLICIKNGNQGEKEFNLPVNQ